MGVVIKTRRRAASSCIIFILFHQTGSDRYTQRDIHYTYRYTNIQIRKCLTIGTFSSCYLYKYIRHII